MREIKFRAWDKDCDVMVYSDQHNHSDYNCNYWFDITNFNVSCTWNEEYEDIFGYPKERSGEIDNVMQYTGLKDKNGKEIYEGDILHLFGKGYHEGVDYNGCVQFLDGGFCVTDGYKEWGLRRYDLSRCDLELEVVGNIYENPKLLESEVD